MRTSEDVARAARGCIGVRFRAQGRGAARGLDCIGVAAVAYGDALRGPVPDAYPQRGGAAATIGAEMARAGLRAIDPAGAGEGDLLLLATGRASGISRC